MPTPHAHLIRTSPHKHRHTSKHGTAPKPHDMQEGALLSGQEPSEEALLLSNQGRGTLMDRPEEVQDRGGQSTSTSTLQGEQGSWGHGSKQIQHGFPMTGDHGASVLGGRAPPPVLFSKSSKEGPSQQRIFCPPS